MATQPACSGPNHRTRPPACPSPVLTLLIVSHVCVLDSFGGVLDLDRIVGHNERLELRSRIMILFTTLPFQA